jgi:RNA polymerase sigma factor (sigma-70 family)
LPHKPHYRLAPVNQKISILGKPNSLSFSWCYNDGTIKNQRLSSYLVALGRQLSARGPKKIVKEPILDESGDNPSFDDVEKFQDLMRRVREGSEDAAWEVWRDYAKLLFHTVRRILNPKLRSQLDSGDFAQWVWLSFYRVREKAGRFETPQQLIKFLLGMAENKVQMETRHRLATEKHNIDREVPFRESLGEEDPGVTAREPGPVDEAIARERWERLLQGQSPRCRRIIQLKRQRYSCGEIGKLLDIDPETVRRFLKKLLRANLE